MLEVLASALISMSVTQTGEWIQLDEGDRGRIVGGGGALDSWRLELEAEPTGGIGALPPDLENPAFGALRFDGHSFRVVLDRANTDRGRLYVDIDGDGDLIDDGPVRWTKKRYPRGDMTYTAREARVQLQLTNGTDSRVGVVNLLEHDNADPLSEEWTGSLSVSPGWAHYGKAKLGKRTYDLAVLDTRWWGDRPRGPSVAKGLHVFINRDRDGDFTFGRESIRADEAVWLNGRAYAAVVADGGARLRFEEVDQLPQLTIGPALRRGDLAVPFEAKSADGQEFMFSESFGERLILLRMLSWRDPGIESIRSVLEEHADDIAVVMVSLRDQRRPLQTEELEPGWVTVTGEWAKLVHRLYPSRVAPSNVLIDGATGRVIAAGSSVHDMKLEQVLRRSLKAR